MVGVKGKYKGCNTCRVRRVKCDNTRPFCKKCTDHGRVCEGYERETVFIVGTVDDKGRCASHPPRNLGQPQGSTSTSTSNSPSPSRVNSRKKQAKAAAAAAAAADATAATATIGSSFSSSPSSSAASPQASLREASSASPSAFLPSTLGRGRGSPFVTTLGGVSGGGGGSSSGIRSTAAITTETARREPLEPLVPAWGDGDAVALVSAASLLPTPPTTAARTFFYRLRFLALRTPQLDAVLKSVDPTTPEGQLTLSLPPSRHRGAAATATAASSPDEVGFRLSAQCFVHVPPRALGQVMMMHHAGGPGPGYPPPTTSTTISEGVCLFLYEHNASASRSNQPPWRDPTILADPILSLGPLHFQSFPSHHLFARVYRPNAIMTSLLARTPCHLASPEWTTVPYELHPKSSLDSLLDVISVLPSLFHRADRILPLPLPLPHAALGRRLKAKDLLANCLSLEAQLARWYAGIEMAAAGNRDMPLLYWIHGSNLNLGGRGVGGHDGIGGGGLGGGKRLKSGGGGGRRRPGRQRHAQIPFADTFDFASTVVGLGHVYYWTALMLLYECMAALVDVVLYDGSGASADPSADPPGDDGFTTASIPSRRNFIALAAPVTPAAPGARPLEDMLPPGCEAARYQVRERRKLAANICRSLDWVIGGSPSILLSSSSSVTEVGGQQQEEEVYGGGEDEEEEQQQQQQQQQLDDDVAAVGHPDLALAPLHVVERFYGALWSPDGRDGELERTWCRGFRARLEERGREVEAWVGGRGWVEVGRFG